MIDDKLNDTILISFEKKLLKAESCENKAIFLLTSKRLVYVRFISLR